MPYTPAIDSAAFYTVEYFKIGRIADHIYKWSGKSNYSYLDNYHELVFDWHRILETEIDQHIHGSTENLQNQYFEHLREVLDIVNTWNDESIIRAIDKYNNEAEVKFYKAIEEKVEAFRKSTEYLTRAHKEEWEEYPPPNPFFSSANLRLFKTKRIHYKWYIVDGGPDVLDVSFIPQYLEFVRKITDNFKRIANSTLKLWDEKKIKSNASINLVLPPVQTSQPQRLLEQPEDDKRKKLKVNLSVKQLLYLFKMLKDAGIVEVPLLKDIHKFVGANFETNAKGAKDDISAANLAKLWSTISADPQTAAYWMDKFIDLHNLAKKDNPNNIRLK